MSTEITDKTGLDAAVGRSIIVWDDECSACNAMKRRVESYATARGYVFCPMRIWLEAHPEASAGGMYVLTPAGRQLFAVDAALHVATLVWWLRPLHWISRLPIMHTLMAAGYRWFAAHRHAFGCKACEGGQSSCRLNDTRNSKAD